MTNDELNKILRERVKRIKEINKELEDLMIERKYIVWYGFLCYFGKEKKKWQMTN